LGYKGRLALSLLCVLTGIITVFSGAILLRQAPYTSVSFLSLVLFYMATGLCWVLAAGILLGVEFGKEK